MSRTSTDRHGDAPLRRHFSSRALLQFAIELLAPDGHLRRRSARPMASRSAVCAASSTARVKSPTSVQAAFASHTVPEQHGVHVRAGTRSARKRFFGAERGHAHAAVDAHHVLLDDGDGPEKPRAADAIELAQAQNHDLFPLLGNMGRHYAHKRRDKRNGNAHGADSPAQREPHASDNCEA